LAKIQKIVFLFFGESKRTENGSKVAIHLKKEEKSMKI
jgi:hypothetical protein